ncbi:4870_t:CDS:2 [Funneliformis mosseae]|uniref:4870_t:CDS:1 n=1 Tax=Funneliformis mosseae TaxID=27381 RepID=A0A9N9C193_FUNMO|nr:4870_t:CDS:2 [Funneliformis mosseae]
MVRKFTHIGVYGWGDWTCEAKNNFYYLMSPWDTYQDKKCYENFFQNAMDRRLLKLVIKESSMVKRSRLQSNHRGISIVRDPNFLSILQDFAKDNADTRSIIVVFVASESLISQFQQSRSAWSRAIIPLEIDDIPDEQAVKFLQDFNVDPKIAEYAVKYLTGGRFALLTNFHSIYKINPGENSLKKSKEILFWQIEGKLFTVGLPTNHEFFRKLIEVHHCIDIEEAESYILLDMIRKLVKVNILKEHQDYTVSFHSYLL